MTIATAVPAERIRVVVVEDDDGLRDLTVSYLSGRGLAVCGVASAEALYRYLSVESCDIVVLDVGLPGESGYSVARHLRQISTIGVVMLTGRSSSSDMVRGLDTGADIYLIKPVDLDVLAATVNSLARRLAAAAVAAEAPASRWSLDADGWNLSPPQGNRIALSKAERAFLLPLFAVPGTPVERETLIHELTDEPWDFDPHRLEVLLHRLRARIKSLTGLVLPVRAVRGVGYVFAGEAS